MLMAKKKVSTPKKAKLDASKPPKLSEAERALLSERSKKFDPNASADDCVDDLRKVQETNPLKHITRNFYRNSGKYSDATWGQFFGTFLEFRRQAKLELSRGQHTLERHIAKHASLDLYRKFYQTEVLPYHEKYVINAKDKKRFKTILVGSDFHDEEADPFVLATFIDTAHRVQPDVIVLNGDIFDLYEFSRFSQDPRQCDILGRFNFVKTHIFASLRRACPNAQIDLICGNHEWRLLNLMSDKTPGVRVVLGDVMGQSLAQVFGLDEFEINMVCKLDLAAYTQSDVMGELKENYKVYYNAFVASHFKDLNFGLSGTSGHTHRPEVVTFASLPMGKLSWTTTGCVAHTKAEYVQGMDKWTNSFMLAHIDTETKSVSSEHFMIPRDHVVIHGKLYVRKNDSST
jgi:hypothetical protein